MREAIANLRAAGFLYFYISSMVDVSRSIGCLAVDVSQDVSFGEA